MLPPQSLKIRCESLHKITTRQPKSRLACLSLNHTVFKMTVLWLLYIQLDWFSRGQNTVPALRYWHEMNSKINEYSSSLLQQRDWMYINSLIDKMVWINLHIVTNSSLLIMPTEASTDWIVIIHSVVAARDASVKILRTLWEQMHFSRLIWKHAIELNHHINKKAVN